MPDSRREREEALIAHMRENAGQWHYAESPALYEDLDRLYAALEAAHKREDAIRGLADEWIDGRSRMYAILDGENA